MGNPKSLGWRALEAIRSSKGTAVAVTDEEILEAQSLLGRMAGVFTEPSAAASLAALLRLREEGIIDRKDLIVCNLTGHGLKQPLPSAGDLLPIPPELDVLREQLEIQGFPFP